MEQEALTMKVPKSVAGDYYTLRSSIDFVRSRIVRDGYGVTLMGAQPDAAASDWDSGSDEDV